MSASPSPVKSATSAGATAVYPSARVARRWSNSKAVAPPAMLTTATWASSGASGPPLQKMCIRDSLQAYRSTRDERWRKEARRAFEWFLGRNDLGLPVYDPNTGGCGDGLHPDRLNHNQGAESTLAFLQTLLELRLAADLPLPTEKRIDEPWTARAVSATPA